MSQAELDECMSQYEDVRYHDEERGIDHGQRND